MTIKQQGGVFGRNPSFNDVDTLSLNVSRNGSIKQLSVGGDFAPSYDIDLRDSDPGISLRDTDANNSQSLALIGSNVSGSLIFRADPNNVGNFTTRIDFCVDGTVADAYLDKDKNLTLVNGNLVIGTSGKGIDFSATSGTGTSELFDDYEEGTWTPALSGSTSGSIPIGTTAFAYYTKIGRVVKASAYLAGIDVSSSTLVGNIRITGFPYSSLSSFGNGVLQVTYSNILTADVGDVPIQGGIEGTRVDLRKGSATGTYSAADLNAAVTGGVMVFNIIYETGA